MTTSSDPKQHERDKKRERDDDRPGVVDGPLEPAEPLIDPEKVGPDGTEYDDDALDEVARKMGIDDA